MENVKLNCNVHYFLERKKNAKCEFQGIISRKIELTLNNKLQTCVFSEKLCNSSGNSGVR